MVTGGEISRLRNIQNLISPQIKKRFFNNNQHKILTQHMSSLNCFFQEFME